MRANEAAIGDRIERVCADPPIDVDRDDTV